MRLIFNPVHQSSDLQIFTFYCKMLCLVCVIVVYIAKCCKYSGVCYNERCYNERMLQRTVFIYKIRMLQRTEMLQRTRRNTIGRRSTRVCMMFRAFPPWLKRQSSSLLSFVRFSYQFNPLNAELNSICHLLALLGAHHIFHVSRIRVNSVISLFAPL